jgi:hypothetical protein
MIRNSRRRGQATLEFAMVLPIIVALILGLQLTASGISSSINLTNAAEAGAQAAADTLDQVDAALSCTSPETYACVHSATQLMGQMVQAGLPCYAPYDTDNDTACKGALRFLAGPVAGWAAGYCGTVGGCKLPPQVLTLVGAAGSCPNITYPSCADVGVHLGQAVMEAGLGCDGHHTICPDPVPPLPGCTGACRYPPSCVSPCDKATMLELVGGFSQLGLACAAVRRSLGLPSSITTCEGGHINTNGQPDDPWFDTPTLNGLPYIPHLCSSTGAPTKPLLLSTCLPGQTFIEHLTVHWDHPPNTPSKLVASATAVPASQFVT